MSGVVVERAGLVESVHRAHVAVVDSEGRLTASSVTNTLGEDVGVIRADFRLERHA